MSARTLIEINHDFGQGMRTEAFIQALARFVSSADSESADALELFGVRVIAMRHHSDKFIVAGHPDGFPVLHVDADRDRNGHG